MPYTLTESETASLTTLEVTLATFSFLCSLALICCYVFFPRLRSFAFRLVCWISTADVFFSIGHMIGDPDVNSGGCRVQAYMIVYFELVSLFWTVSIARVLQLVILQGATDVESRERRMIWVCWGLPLLLVLLPETTRSYGDSGPFCWVKGDTGADQAWRFLIFYLWLWAGVAYIVWVYWKIHQSFKGMDELDPSSVEYQQAVARKATINRMKYYPMALIVCYFWASIDRIYSSVEGNRTSYTLFFLHIMGEATKGCVNSLIYGYTGNAGVTLKAAALRQLHKAGVCLQVEVPEEPMAIEGDEAPGAEADDNEAPGQVIITDGSDQR